MSIMPSRRQIIVQRENLAAMCRISVKSLLDYACLYTHVDDDCEEFINFCAVFEQMVSHRLRPYQKKVWLPGQGSPRHFWDVLLENHNRTRGFLFSTCIPNIEAIETIKSPKAKLRAFIRVALMEKRLSDYLYWLLDNANLVRESFLDGALLASDEATVLCGDLIGLNAIDFNFCLKGNENVLLGPLEISYAPFLKYKQTSASRCSDEIEMLRLSGKDTEDDIHAGSILTERNVNDILRLQNLEKDYKSIKEQKDYLEELVRLRERKIGETNVRMESLRLAHEKMEREREKERRMMDECVLELQTELANLRKQNASLKEQVMRFQQRVEMKEIPMMDMATGEEVDGDKSEILVEMDRMYDGVSMSNASLTMSLKKEPSHIPSDKRSIMSSVSDHIRLKEDSQSMVPLTGSLADVNAAMLDTATKEHSEVDGKNKVQAGFHACDETGPENEAQVEPGTKETEQSSSNELMLQEANNSQAGGNDENKSNNFEEEIVIPATVNVVESYVATQDKKMAHAFEHVSTTEDGGSVRDSSTAAEAPSTDTDSAELTEEEHIVMVSSDGCGSTESNAESEKEEEVGTSDPEIVNPSSDNSDTAWEMLSDSEQNENSHQ